MKRRFLTFTLLLAIAAPAFAYKQIVHRIITRHAWNRALPNLALQKHIGLNPQVKVDGRVPVEWAELGVDEEDDGINAISHFYDPRHEKSLTIGNGTFCDEIGVMAPSRALGETLANDANIGAINRYYLYSVIDLSDAERKTAARKLFTALGHHIHLIQDMAQPEHTRNDPHLPLPFGTTPASIYEEWGLMNLISISPTVSYEGYPTVRFPNHRDYWHTNDLAMGFPVGKGLADFSNNHFVTQDTNYHDTDGCYSYTLPMIPADPAALRVETRNEAVWLGGIQVVMPVESEIYTSSIADHATNVADSDPYHTFHSTLDHETRHLGAPVYSLGDGSYLTRASMLIPRAVGYSAGLLEHVFRGKMDLKFTRDPDVQNRYDIEITNQSGEAIGSDARFFSYYIADIPTSPLDIHDIRSGYLTQLIPGFNGIPSGASVTIEDVDVLLPQGKSLEDFEKRIALTATLGTGPAVIGLVQPPSGTPVFVKIRNYPPFPHDPPQTPMPPTTQLRIYIAEQGAEELADLRRVDGTWAPDGQSVIASTRIPDGATYRVLSFHQTFIDPRLAPHPLLITVAKSEAALEDVFHADFIDQYGVGLHDWQYAVSQCLPVTATAPPVMTPPGYLFQNQYRGACGVQFYLAGNPFEE